MKKTPNAQSAEQMQALCEELAQRAARVVHKESVREVLPELFFSHRSTPRELGHGVYRPCLCLIAQGSKEVLLADERYRYDPAHYLIVTATLPVASRIVEASPAQPFLGVVLNLDPLLVSSVMGEAGYTDARSRAPVKAVNVSPLSAELLDAVLRLARLLDTPADAQFLAPLIKREIIYRLLTGEQGSRLRYLSASGGNTQRITEAISRLHREFEQPLRIEEMARGVDMSVSSFHHHFKQVTAMSPLQFQKHLRLQEARRLMLSEHFDAASAGVRVGYDDPSHFSREYKRFFGAPPMGDVERMRAFGGEHGGG